MTAKRMNQRKRRNQLASALAFSMAIGSVAATGCSSSVGARVASLNPFSSGPADTVAPGEIQSNWLNAPKKVSSSIAGGAKSAATASRDTVASWFGGGPKETAGEEVVGATDPTSLAHKAEVTPDVFVANGRLWESTGNFEKAMESYAKALQKSPNDPAALAHIARLHFRQNNHEKAVEYFGKAIKQKPDDAGLFNDLGLTLSKLGNHGAAASTIEQALKLTPNSSRYANNLASVKFEAGDPAGALEVLVKNNKPAVAHFNMAYLHYKHSQGSEATRHLNQALAYQKVAENDPATQRAVERSKELLAQIGNMPGATPTNPGLGNPAAMPASIASNAPTQGVATPTQGVGQTAPPSGIPATTPGMQPGNSIPGFANAVQPASTGKTPVNFGGASFKATNGTSTAAATAVQPGAGTPSGSSTPATQGKFSLPPSFQMPQ